MNDDSVLDPALKDRMDIIEVSDYSIDEKKIILNDYMLPRALKQLRLGNRDIVFNISALNFLTEYLFGNGEVGLRRGEKVIKSIVSQVNMYLSILLPDGTTGDIELPYSFPKSCKDFPIKINIKMIKELLSV